nr:hypothetical protein [Tanacetum cinerariifolium]
MIAFLTKSDASEGFDQILDFLNAHTIQYALMVNPPIYVSCIKQFWASVLIKKSNDIMKLQALIDRKKVIITEDTIRHNLRLDDVDGIDCLPNEEIYTELAQIGYEKPSTKLTFYKAFFSAQWKFLIHTIVQCMSAKRTSWNEFSSSMASAVIYLTTALEITKLKQRIKKLEKKRGFKSSGLKRLKKVGTSQRVKSSNDTVVDDQEDASKQEGKIAELDANEDVTLVDVDAEVEMDTNIQGRMAESQAKAYNLDLQHSKKVLSMQASDEAEPAEVEEMLRVVTAAKLMTELVTTASPITTAAQVPKASAPRRRRGVIIQDLEEKAAASVIVHSEVQSKEKGKGILIEEPKPLKGQAQIDMDKAFARQLKVELNANINWNDVIEQVKRSEKQDNTVMRYQAFKRKPVTEAQARKNMMIYLKNMAGFKMNFFKGMTYNEIRPLFEKHYNSNQAFLERVEEEVTIQEKEIKEEGSKRKGKSLEQKIAKKQWMDEEAEELKIHLQIIANDDDDVYTEATPLSSKVLVVDYQIHHENNKPYYKIIRAGGTHKLFLSFIILLKNFDREDLETLWKLVKERFESTKPKNFSDDFLLNILKIMFEKPNVEANMFLLVEKKYHLTHFTLEQMLNNVRLKVEEESEMLLELLRVDDLDGEVVIKTATRVKDSATLTTDGTEDDVIMAQALAALKSTKPKVVVQEQEMSTIIPAVATIVTTAVPTPRAKGKAKMIEPEVSIKRKEHMRIDDEYARKLEAEEEEAARLNRAQQDEEANSSWDNIQAMIDTDRLLAEKL